MPQTRPREWSARSLSRCCRRNIGSSLILGVTCCADPEARREAGSGLGRPAVLSPNDVPSLRRRLGVGNDFPERTVPWKASEAQARALSH